MVSKFYKKNIIGGKSIFYFSFAFAVLIRIVYLLFSTKNTSLPCGENSNSFLWSICEPYFVSPIISCIASFVCIVSLASIASYLNKRFVLIKIRTALVGSVILVAFSCNPIFFSISPEYLTCIALLTCIGLVFDAYENSHKQVCALYIGGTLAIGSLFQISLLCYLPILWIGLAMVKGFNFKSFLASIIGILLIYIPVFTYYYLYDQVDSFFAVFIGITASLQNVPMLNWSTYQIIANVIFTLSVILVISQNYNSRYVDKIKIRTFMLYLSIISVISFLSVSLINFSSLMNLYIGIVSICMLAAHFFALANYRWITWFFYIILFLAILFCFFDLYLITV